MQLNPQQDAAKCYVDGPLLVLAGAGSGKTRVITEKIAHLIDTLGYLPEKIAAVTFTNKAAKEMTERVRLRLGGEAIKGLTISTFHSLGLRIIRSDLEKLGYRPGFSIFDTADSRGVIRESLTRQLSNEEIDQLIWRISAWKSAAADPTFAAKTARNEIDAEAAKVYAEYQQQLQNFNAVDFDDLIMRPLQLLNDDNEARAKWQHKLRYLLVDEYQDTNTSQYRLLKLLVGDGGGLTAVGDDDQSIYGWRGAQPENISLLKRDYPALKVVKLEQNYRSSRKILRAANTVIANNPHEFSKNLWSDLGDGEDIRIHACDSAEHEAERVIGEIIHRRFVHKSELGDFAILYRSNHQSRLMEQTLRAHRLPYQISGGPSFFDRAEIKDMLCYLRVLANPRDDQAFLRVVNTPRRELGAATMQKVATFAAEAGRTLYDAARSHAIASKLAPRAASAMQRYVDWLEQLRTDSGTTEVAKLVKRMIDDSDYLSYIDGSSKDPQHAEKRKKNLDDFIAWLRRVGVTKSGKVLTLTELLQRAMLQSNDDNDDKASNQVRLMTLHAAKGLEFPHVFMVGVEEGTLPHRSSLEEGSLEEERRLMYVGITRAQRSLAITYAARRRRAREDILAEPSRFLEELPQEIVQWHKLGEAADPAESKERAKAHLGNLRALLAD